MTAAALSVTDPPVAGGAMPGRRLLGLVQRIMRTGMGMARRINRAAQRRLMGEELARLGPAGFNPTATNALVVEAVGWTAALRQRLLDVVRPRLAPGLPKEEQAERAPQARGRVVIEVTEATAAAIAGEWHDWFDLARPLRIGPNGVAAAARAMAGLSDREVVTEICGKLQRAAEQLGAEADVPRIAALAAAARALCPDVEAVAEVSAEAKVVDGGEVSGGAGDAPTAWVAGSSPAMTSNESETGDRAETEPEGGQEPPEPPD